MFIKYLFKYTKADMAKKKKKTTMKLNQLLRSQKRG